MTLVLILAFGVPLLVATLLVWPCLFLAARADEKMAQPTDAD